MFIEIMSYVVLELNFCWRLWLKILTNSIYNRFSHHKLIFTPWLQLQRQLGDECAPT